MKIKQNKWEKSGNAASGFSWTNKAKFNFPARVKEIMIYYPTNRNDVALIKIHCDSRNLLAHLLAKCIEQKIPLHDIPHFPFDRVLSVVTNQKNIIAAFLNVLSESLYINKTTKEDIMNTFNLLTDKEYFYNEMKLLVNTAQFSKAFEQVKSMKNNPALFRLGQYCESQQNFSDALEAYQEIPESNPLYEQANWQAAHCIMAHQTASERDSKNLTSEARREYQEKELRFLLRANEVNSRRLVDQLYHEYSGGKDLNPSIKNVACAENTVIALAQQTFSLRNEHLIAQQNNKKLMDENKELIDENAHLKEQLAKANSNASCHPHRFFNSRKIKHNQNGERKEGKLRTFNSIGP